jgi:DNA-binding NtrC family response regulator
MNIDDTKQHLQNGSFDVMVLNGRMPGGPSAAEMYHWMQANCAGMESRLLLTFSTLTDQETRRFLQEQNVPSLAKPFEVADLISQVLRLLQKEDAAESKTAAAGAG